jgi:hypothetical protein
MNQPPPVIAPVVPEKKKRGRKPKVKKPTEFYIKIEQGEFIVSFND